MRSLLVRGLYRFPRLRRIALDREDVRSTSTPVPLCLTIMPRLLRGTLVAATLWLVLDVVRAAL